MMIVTKHTAQKILYAVVAALALVLLAPNHLDAAPQTTNFDMTGVGSGTVLAGVYTSPYTATVGSSTGVSVICDDFADDTYVPETWTAYVTSLSSITTGTDPYTSDLRWQTSAYAPSLTQVQAYEAAALLSIDILGSGAGSVAQQDYSFALWGLFDPTDAFGQLTSYGDTTARNTAITDLNTAISDVTNPLARINGVSLSTYLSNWDVTIYSYDTGATGAGCGGPCPVPQEFITAVDPPTTGMAEPPAPALLGLDLLGIAGLILMARRRGWLAR